MQTDFNRALPAIGTARRAGTGGPRNLVATLMAAGLLGTGSSAGAAGLLNPCTGISLPRSSVFNYLDPVLGPLFTAPLLGPILGLTGLGPVYNNLASGQPLALSLLGTDGVLLAPTDDCKLSADGYSLDVDKGISIGGNAITGLGTNGATASAGAKNAVAIGDGASTGAAAQNALALGSNASVADAAAAAGAVALGAGSQATGVLAAAYVPAGGSYAVAGNGAGANRELSIGTTGNERRITHVAAGGADTDAVNVSQLKSAVSAIDIGATNAVQYDTAGRQTVTLLGTTSTDGGVSNGTRIGNVAQGTLSSTSTEAVNGAQLNATNLDVATNTTNLGSLTTNIGNGTVGLVRQVGGAPGAGAITVGSSTGGSSVDFTGTAGSRVLSGVAAGVAVTDAVNLGQLNAVGSASANAVHYDTASRLTVTLLGTASTDGGVSNGTRIGNLAQGALSTTSTEAVNGAQLHATNQNIGTLVNVFGGNAMINFDGSVTGPTYTLSTITAGGGTAVGNYTTVGDALSALGSSVVNLGQTVNNAGPGGAGSKYVQVTSTLGAAVAIGSDSIAVGPQAVASGASSSALGNGAQATSGGGVALGAGAVASRAGLGGQVEALSGVAVTSTQGAVSIGAAGGERQITNLAGGTQATDAVNLRQLQAVQAGGVNYSTGPDGAVNYNQITLGNGQAPNGTVISNVAPGVASGDAVNVQQLTSGVAAANQYTDARVNRLQQGMENVAKKAYAGVAAAMAMESPPYVPGKVSYAAALGQYESQSAVGVSLRSTAVNGRWSVSGGVSATGAGGVAARVGISGVFE